MLFPGDVRVDEPRMGLKAFGPSSDPNIPRLRLVVIWIILAQIKMLDGDDAYECLVPVTSESYEVYEGVVESMSADDG